jgi:hypothetical protein
MDMREYDPIDRNPDLRRSDPIVTRDESSGLGTLGLIAALAVAVAGGIYYFSNGGNDRVAMNNPPATTGQTATPPSVPDQGKTDSN